MASEIPFFVGRERELAELSTALDEAAAGRGALYLVAGEPGIGKTCFAEVFAALTAARGASVLRGSCWEGEGAPPYWPWTQVIRALLPALARGVDTGRAGAPYLAAIVPELAGRVEQVGEAVAPAAPESDAARFQLFDAVAGLLASASARRVLLILLDDLHWADAASLLLLRFLARELRDTRVLIVGCHRERESRPTAPILPLILDLARHGHRITLRGLDLRQTGTLLCQLLGQVVDDALLGAVHRHSEGNPLFVHELARVLPAGRPLDPGRPLPLPETIRGVIDGRLAPLPAACRPVLRAAAVNGRDFDLSCLEHACGLGHGEILDRLAAPVRNGIVGPTDSPGRYRFSHALIREALYLETPPSERAALHLRVGEGLEAMRGMDLEPPLSELAHHYESAVAAGGSAKAIAYMRRSAEHAMRHLAWEEAARGFTKALELMARADLAGRERCEVLLGLGEAYKLCGRRQEAGAALREATAIARVLADVELLARAAQQHGDTGLGPMWTEFGRTSTPLVSLLEEAVAALGAGDRPLRTRLLARLATELYWADAAERRHRLSEEALASARRLGNPATLGYALLARVVAVADPDNLDERLALEDEIVALARAIGDRELELTTLQWRLGDALQRGEEAALGEDLERFLALIDELRLPRYRWLAPAFRSQLALLRGRLDEAEAECGRMLVQAQEVEHEDPGRLAAALWFGILRERDRLGELEGGIRQLTAQEVMGAVWPAALAQLYAEIGRREEALAAIDELAPGRFAALRRDVTFLFCAGALAEAAWLLGEPRHAAELHALLAPYAERLVLAGPATIYCFGPVRHHLGCLAALLERWDEASRHFTAAVATSERLGMRVLAARTRIAHARCLLAHGARERAREMLDDAAAVADELGLAGLRVQADAVRSAMQRSAAGPAPYGDGGILHRDGAAWTAFWQGRRVLLRDAKSLRCLDVLVRNPGRAVSCAELVRAVEGDAGTSGEDERAAERARVKARRLVRSAIEIIRREHPALAQHLGDTIRTGARCSYAPRRGGETRRIT
ncbi:MAG: AAA family ATPase [Thermodesulfobacteriota bacterium]